MSVVSRGVKNAFRNGLRTSAVVLILAISIGLSLSMMVANKAVEGRIADLKEDIGTTIRINPAGAQGFEGGGEPLTNGDLNKVRATEHVASADGVVQFMLQTKTDDDVHSNFMIRGGGNAGETDLESPVEPGTLGKRFNNDSSTQVSGGGGTAPDIKLPIRGIGTDGNRDDFGTPLNITDGRALKDGDTYSAIIGTTLAEKNNLKVGSTFTAYDKKFTVVGIMDQETEFANATVVIPLAVAQELSETDGEVSAIIAQADSIESLEAAMAGIKDSLGENADVTTTQQNIQEAIESLRSVQSISIVGFISSLAAAALIVLMVMFVIVRERRREIGVLKAIGGSNRTIVGQFIVEAIVLVGMGGIIGLGAAVVSSGAVANALVSSSVSSTDNEDGLQGGPAGGGAVMRFKASGDTLQDTKELVGDVTASVGAATVAYGVLGMLAVAVAGSAIPAWLIAKVRPAEVLRGE
jgi:putative ABC transport system permease protein